MANCAYQADFWSALVAEAALDHVEVEHQVHAAGAIQISLKMTALDGTPSARSVLIVVTSGDRPLHRI